MRFRYLSRDFPFFLKGGGSDPPNGDACGKIYGELEKSARDIIHSDARVIFNLARFKEAMGYREVLSLILLHSQILIFRYEKFLIFEIVIWV